MTPVLIPTPNSYLNMVVKAVIRIILKTVKVKNNKIISEKLSLISRYLTSCRHL